MKRRSGAVPHVRRRQSMSRSCRRRTLSKQVSNRQVSGRQISLRRKTAPGELLKESRLLTGDCLPLLARLPSGSVDLTVTSPPYDDLRRYDTPTPLDLPKLAEALFRVTKDGGVCIVVMGDASRHFAKSLSSFRLALSWCDRAGWRLFETCLYHRHGVPGPWWRSRLRVNHEFIFIFLAMGLTALSPQSAGGASAAHSGGCAPPPTARSAPTGPPLSLDGPRRSGAQDPTGAAAT